jgi:hypothetical protein
MVQENHPNSPTLPHPLRGQIRSPYFYSTSMCTLCLPLSRNRLGMVSVIPRQKVLIPRHSEIYERVSSEARNRWKWQEKNQLLQKIVLRQTECFRPRQLLNGIPRVCFYFGSTERNSELFSLPRNCSEQNSKCLPLFLFHGIEFRVVISFAVFFGTEF